MDILEFAFWSGWVGLLLTGAVIELIKIMIKEWKKWKKSRRRLSRLKLRR